jgi:hypothetical protein
MPKQYLLQPDGSIPENVNVEALREAGIPLVMPSPIPSEPGMIAVEQEPQQDHDGIWRQVWALEPAPPAEPPTEVDPMSVLAGLSEEQKQALIALLSQR